MRRQFNFTVIRTNMEEQQLFMVAHPIGDLLFTYNSHSIINGERTELRPHPKKFSFKRGLLLIIKAFILLLLLMAAKFVFAGTKNIDIKQNRLAQVHKRNIIQRANNAVDINTLCITHAGDHLVEFPDNKFRLIIPKMKRM